MTTNITVDTRTVVRVLSVTFLFLFAISFIAATRQALTLILVASFLALALNPPVSYLSSKMTGGRRAAATAMAYLIVLSVIGLFLWAIIPPFVDQTREFADNIPEYIDELSSADTAISRFIRDNNLDQEAREFVDDLTDGGIGTTTSQVFSGIGRVGAAIVSLVTVLVLTFFMLVEGPQWFEKFWLAQPEDKREHRKEIAHRMHAVVIGYVNGQLLIALLASISSLIAMLIVGIPLPLPLAGVVGLFGLIPLVGATLGSLVVILVALFKSFYAALIMLAFFLIYQQIENNFVQPYIQSRTLDVSPLLIFVAVLLGINLGGLLGAFIAIPAAACGRILLANYFDQRAVSKHKKPNPLITLKSDKAKAK